MASMAAVAPPLHPVEHFAADYDAACEIGRSVWWEADVAVVGLARNCAPWLRANLARLVGLTASCRSWRLHIETNDNVDDTDQVLVDFCREHSQATFTSRRLDRPQLPAEFAGPRTYALAEYRTACQRWVQDTCPSVDFVVVIDWDMCGGWSQQGVMHGVGAMTLKPDAFGMASVSLMEYEQPGVWLHYDAWALRLNSAYDDYTAGTGQWKHHWLPPVGSPPVPVCSAFGGFAIYDTEAYLAGRYDGRDCEHVAAHVSMAERTGRKLYLDPAMRTVMRWLEPNNGGQYGKD